MDDDRIDERKEKGVLPEIVEVMLEREILVRMPGDANMGAVAGRLHPCGELERPENALLIVEPQRDKSGVRELVFRVQLLKEIGEETASIIIADEAADRLRRIEHRLPQAQAAEPDVQSVVEGDIAQLRLHLHEARGHRAGGLGRGNRVEATGGIMRRGEIEQPAPDFDIEVELPEAVAVLLKLALRLDLILLHREGEVPRQFQMNDVHRSSSASSSPRGGRLALSFRKKQVLGRCSVCVDRSEPNRLQRCWCISQ